MESPKYSRADAFIIRPAEGTEIYEYPCQSKSLRISYIKVSGRRPAGLNEAFIEHDCTFSLYVVKGRGSIIIEGKTYELKEDDVVTVLAGKRWIIEGELSYIVATTPAFYPEQSEVIDLNDK